MTMKYCSQCGQPVEQRIPDGDNLPRHVCTACHTIHYENPKIVAGCIAEWEDRILLCRRAIEPRHGLWTLPAGFMENRESTREAALRETWEEARARVDIQSLYAVYSIPHISQVYMVFRGVLLEPVYEPGPESLAVDLFREQEIPWDTLAFPVMEKTLRRYFADRHSGRHGDTTHVGEIIRPMGRQR
jgi:ADP-ribose pyrophosphatase YjhB (NUDIX family)